ncbi:MULTISPECIES: MerR family transcriptional regulator [Brevibacterium]|uniref:MerR family transcriptional regulator n=1 Tax=Brevibacterium salitolerans TaxID=1403566 RepID=A0ABN2W9Z1_9MICO|nr:MerR family transcriptional regulator [Brevibacterium sp.]
MKLSELAAAADTTTASVKFYIREGLLPPGEKRNQTTAVYGRPHLERLELILGLRRHIGSSLETIRALTEVIDDPEAGDLAVMEAAQTLAVGERRPPEGRAEASGGGDGREALRDVMETQGWPDAASAARAAVEERIARSAAVGIEWRTDTLRTIADAVGRIGTLGLDMTGSRDRTALGVAVGTYELSRLVVDMLRLAQTSESISRLSGGRPTGPE